MPVQMSGFPPFSAADDLERAAAEEDSEHSLNDSSPPTPASTHEDISSQTPEIAEAEILYPYAIEEPDDESHQVVHTLDQPSLPDYFERWQRDLIDHMDDLGCNSDTSDGATLSSGEARGQKRKSANPIASMHRHTSPSHRPKSTSGQSEPSLAAPGSSPKRRRRRVRQPGDSARASRPTSLNDFRDFRTSGSSSSDLQSTDVSSVETGNESVTADKMEID